MVPPWRRAAEKFEKLMLSDAVFKGKSSVQCCGRAQVRTLMSCDHHKSTLDRNWLDIHVILTEAGAGLG